MQALERNVPSKVLKGYVHLPWITDKIQRMIKTRRKRHTRAKKSGNRIHWDSYRTIQKAIKKEIKRAHDEYLQNLFDDNQEGGGTKRLWSYVKSLKRDRVGVAPLEHEGRSTFQSVPEA